MTLDMDRRFGFAKSLFARFRSRRPSKGRNSRAIASRLGSGCGLLNGHGFAELEARDVPAIVSWTGSAGNGLWSDARNWSGNSVPTAADEVTISAATAADSGTSGAAGSFQGLTIDVPVVITRIESARPIAFAGGDASLRVTGGESKLLAGLDLNYAGLAVQGSSARLTISGPGSEALSGLIVATEGGQIEWNGLKTLENMVVFVNAGSSVRLPDVTAATNVSELTVRGSLALPTLTSHTGGLISVMEGGKLAAPDLADASGTFVEANGANTVLELPALTNVDRGRFRADAGATIVATALRKVTIGTATAWSFSWHVGSGSRLSLPNLTAIDVASPRGPAEATDARILLRGTARLEAGSGQTARFDGKVTISMAGDSTIAGTIALGSKSVLTGSGKIEGSLDNAGTIAPSGDFSPYGTITITGDLMNRPGATVDMQMGAATKLDRIFVRKNATIYGGTLKVSLTDEFATADTPVPIGKFALMTWANWGGQFTSTPGILPRSDGTGVTAQSLYEPTGLVQSLGQHRTDNDVISISDLAVKEGNAAISYGYFVIRRTGPMTVPITVEYEVIPGTAKSGTNFTFPGGPITFAPGETERRIRFVIRGNRVFKGDVSFQVRLKSVSDRGELGQSLATVTIQEDDPAPKPVPKAVQKPVVKPAARPKPVKVAVKPASRGVVKR